MYDIAFKKTLNPGKLAPRSIDASILHSLQGQENECLVGPSACFAFNYTTFQFEHVSCGIESVTGYTAEEFMALPDNFMALIYEEDRPVYLKQLAPKLRMVRRQHPRQIKNLVYQTYNRLQKKDGSITYVLINFQLLEWTQDLHPIVCKGWITEINFLGGFHGVALSIFLKEQGSSKLVYQNTFPYENSNVSKRELEVLQHIVDGKTSKEIAKALHISDKTVNNHRQNLLRKLNVRSTSEMVKYALRQQLI